jgi:CheY-like chemotaxis protein
VFLDLQMPLQDGFSVIRELRNDVRFQSLAVVAVTASAMLGERERALAAGFDSYIAKPIDLGDIEKQVELVSSRHPCEEPIS